MLETLKWLKANNESYSDIVISDANLRYYEENAGIATDIPNLRYAYDPKTNESIIDAEAPLNEKEHVYEDDLDNDIPDCDSIVSTKVSSEKMDQLIKKAFKQATNVPLPHGQRDGAAPNMPFSQAGLAAAVPEETVAENQLNPGLAVPDEAENQFNHGNHFAFPKRKDRPASEFMPRYSRISIPARLTIFLKNLWILTLLCH